MTSNLLLLVPLLLTLTLALVLRRTLVALGVGIASGALILSDFSLTQSVTYITDRTWLQFYRDGHWQAWHLNVLAAMVLLGMMTQLLARGGAVKQFADWLYHRIKSGRQARIGIVLLGWVVFIDGIFSCLAVGHVCQPLSQRYKVSREQIAYLVDSNASPLCALLPFSSWGPYVMAILAGISLLPLTPLESFVEMAKMNFYAVTVVLLSLLIAWFGIGFHSDFAIEQNSEDVDAGNPWLLGLPMATLLLASIGLTLYSGASNARSDSLGDWIAAADIGTAMRNACLLATVLAIFMLKLGGRSLNLLLGDLASGVRSIGFAIAILLFTWMIGAVIVDLGIAKLLAGWAEQFLSKDMLVSGTFLLCAIMAFTTGSSWGTFAIMIPIGAEVALTVEPQLLLPALSAVMAGSVFGDHCSPISDTSVISATSSGCAPHDHVITQLPFAIIAALSSLIGFQLINLGVAPLLAWLVVIAAAVTMLAVYHKHYTRTHG
ncbi:sodium:proton antiporter [Shewanella schlegeliana]|uniref:Sodium:proton antiporter n=1 Tax=Shewanella schlegeliana TaxID=190308 RepID=A0ABS1T677_9GAMM|nr:Na+/H+ antiporter NhaC family protein [Shewanella schlegeliana]MBL4914991.1 sodium:proton antiporter [Shewanella schlegeliana]MCL1110597.1 sodium:proton antiporter [Shewanella schlegeliana]GIU32169.1 sodium:proton antiporter [Shewanella schlegeliana]